MWVLIIMLSPLMGFVLCVSQPTTTVPTLRAKDDKSAEDDKSLDEKIYGGRAAGDVPFIASVQRKHSHFCGGSILTLSVIYTACHCVADITLPDDKNPEIKKPDFYDYKDFTVIVGEKDLRHHSWRTQTRHVARFLAHPNCQIADDILEYDYALLTLSQKLERSPNVVPIKLRPGGKAEYDAHWEHYRQTNRRCAVFGWGKTELGDLADTLRVTVMKIISDEVCSFFLSKKHYSYNDYNFTENGKVCATGMMKNNSDCEGDSGGPIFCGGYVMGSVSYGFECGEGEQPAVYATMGELVAWYTSLKRKSPQTLRSRKSESNVLERSSFLCWLFGTAIILRTASSWIPRL